MIIAKLLNFALCRCDRICARIESGRSLQIGFHSHLLQAYVEVPLLTLQAYAGAVRGVLKPSSLVYALDMALFNRKILMAIVLCY